MPLWQPPTSPYTRLTSCHLRSVLSLYSYSAGEPPFQPPTTTGIVTTCFETHHTPGYFHIIHLLSLLAPIPAVSPTPKPWHHDLQLHCCNRPLSHAFLPAGISRLQPQRLTSRPTHSTMARHLVPSSSLSLCPTANHFHSISSPHPPSLENASRWSNPLTWPRHPGHSITIDPIVRQSAIRVSAGESSLETLVVSPAVDSLSGAAHHLSTLESCTRL